MKKLLSFIVVLAVCGVAWAQEEGASTTRVVVSKDTSNDGKILGQDTTVVFSWLATATKDALEIYNCIGVDKQGDVTYNSVYLMKRYRGLVNKELVSPAIGLETDWKTEGGITGGVELFDTKSDKYKNVPANAYAGIAVEGTTDASKGHWNVKGLIGAKINNSLFSGTAK